MRAIHNPNRLAACVTIFYGISPLSIRREWNGRTPCPQPRSLTAPWSNGSPIWRPLSISCCPPIRRLSWFRSSLTYWEIACLCAAPTRSQQRERHHRFLPLAFEQAVFQTVRIYLHLARRDLLVRRPVIVQFADA